MEKRQFSVEAQRGKSNNIESPTITPAAFTAQSKDKICNYCKQKKGWSGRGHIKEECRTKKREISITQQVQVAEETTINIFDIEYAFNTSRLGQNITNDKYNWIYDTGAFLHMTPYLAILKNIRPCNIKIQTAAGITLATQIGTASIYQDDRSIELHNTLYVPQLTFNLLSGQKLRQKGARMIDDNSPRVEFNGKLVFKFTIGRNSLLSVQGTHQNSQPTIPEIAHFSIEAQS
jgi:hypothetical protein